MRTCHHCGKSSEVVELKVVDLEVVELETESVCPRGFWCSQGNAYACDAGSYQDENKPSIDLGACTTCPSGATSAKASKSIADCFCTESFYDELEAEDEVRCVAWYARHP